MTLTFRAYLHNSAFSASPMAGIALNFPLNILSMRFSLVKVFEFDADGHLDGGAVTRAATLPLFELINTVVVIYLLAFLVHQDFFRSFDVLEFLKDSFVSLVLLFRRTKVSAPFLDCLHDRSARSCLVLESKYLVIVLGEGRCDERLCREEGGSHGY